jgi:hypothetical protein
MKSNCWKQTTKTECTITCLLHNSLFDRNNKPKSMATLLIEIPQDYKN